VYRRDRLNTGALATPYTGAKYATSFQTIAKAQSPLRFFGDEVPTGAYKSYYQYRSTCRERGQANPQ